MPIRGKTNFGMYSGYRCICLILLTCRLRLKCNGTRAETRFRLSPKRTSPLKRRGRQFSRLLAAEVFASALVMLDTPSSEVVWEYWLPTPFVSFPFTSPPVCHRVPPGSERALHYNPWYVSSINMPIFRRTNCIITASYIVTLCKRLYSMPNESRLLCSLLSCWCSKHVEDCNVTYILLMNKRIVH